MPEHPSSVVGAIDWGGSKIEVALVDTGGRIVGRRLVVAPGCDPDETLASAARALSALAEAHGLRLTDLRGVGVALPGMVDRPRGRLRFAPDHGIRDFDVRASLGRHLSPGARVDIDNDVRAAAHAEMRYGGRMRGDFLWVTVSSGIGGAVVLAGQVRDGVHGIAGEIGHVKVAGQRSACGCGGVGCLQTVAAAPALVRTARAAGLDVHTAADVGARAAGGDPVAAATIRAAETALADVLAGAITLLDLDLVVLGGGVSQSFDLRFMEEAVASSVVNPSGRRLSIERTALGLSASLLGAASLVDTAAAA